jgi:hypothetical protein
MRPRGSTAVASTITNPGPETLRLPRCIRCQSPALPSLALYWHMGETTMRLARVNSRRDKGQNKARLIEGS